jgi:hypothetical protein
MIKYRREGGFKIMIENKKAINIKDLSIPVPRENNIFFDPERDISDLHWMKMIEVQSRFFTTKNFGNYVEASAYMSILFPNRRMEITEEPVTKEFLFDLFDPENPIIKEFQNDIVISDLKVLYPEVNTKQLEKLDGSTNEKWFEELNNETTDKDYAAEFLAEDVFSFLVLYPEEKKHVVSIPNMYEQLKAGTKELDDAGLTYTQDLFLLKYLYPDVDLPFELTEERLNWFRDKCLEDLMSNIDIPMPLSGADGFVEKIRELAFLKLLTAGKVEITAKGIKISGDNDNLLEKATSKTPERRKF